MLSRDVDFAIRHLLKRPGFSALAPILAVGIGVNTAIYSAVDETLLHPLPQPNLDRICVRPREPSDEGARAHALASPKRSNWSRETTRLALLAHTWSAI